MIMKLGVQLGCQELILGIESGRAQLFVVIPIIKIKKQSKRLLYSLIGNKNPELLFPRLIPQQKDHPSLNPPKPFTLLPNLPFHLIIQFLNGNQIYQHYYLGLSDVMGEEGVFAAHLGWDQLAQGDQGGLDRAGGVGGFCYCQGGRYALRLLAQAVTHLVAVLLHHPQCDLRSLLQLLLLLLNYFISLLMLLLNLV